ncbi:MAG: hypothetical protein U5N55_11995 [Cypionkella sp.]|nr:hypothetical protein [Cypionkella sp.]
MRLDPPVSLKLKAHGDSQLVVSYAFLGLALLFWIAARANDDPIMPAIVYGEFVTSLPAEVWAAALMIASTIHILGIVINGEWRWSPVLRFIGATAHCATLSLFTLTSFAAPYGDFFALGCGVFALVYAVFMWWNWCDIRQAGKGR